MDLITNCDFLTSVAELNETIENSLNYCRKTSLEKSILYSKILWLKEMDEDTCDLEKYLYKNFSCQPKNCSDAIVFNCTIAIQDITETLVCNNQITITNIL